MKPKADAAEVLLMECCGFCFKLAKTRGLEFLIAGPNAYICDECVDVCVVMLQDARDKTAAAKAAESEAEKPEPQK
jgi:ATP-dependent protease Clp ATPase subunit